MSMKMQVNKTVSVFWGIGQCESGHTHLFYNFDRQHNETVAT